MAQQYDAIVIGGGHNGLVAAAYLARSGARTVVLETRPHTGGAATTEALWPDRPELRVTRLSYVMSLMPPTILRDLDLERHGYKVHPMGPYFQAYPDGRSLMMFEDDPRRNHEALAKWSKKDADAYPEWEKWLGRIADVMAPMLMRVPPDIGSHSPTDLLDLAKLAWQHRGVDSRTIADITRLMTMSIAELLDEWFETPEIKGLLAVNGIIGTWAGPYEPGTAYVMAHHSIGDIGDGQLGSWGFPEGGMGAVADAIRKAAESLGAEIRTSTPVAQVTVRGGRATGVVLDSGEELSAPVVVTSLHPKIAFLEHLDRADLPADFVRDIERWRSRSGVAKVNLVLDRLPEFTAMANDSEIPEHLTGSVEMAPDIDFIERAFLDARGGRAAVAPFSDTVIPTTLDRTLLPEGLHNFSMYTQWVPAEWADDPDRAELEAYADRAIALYEEVAPGFTDSIVARDVVGPHEMQEEYSLIGGNIFHGELSVDQLFHLRPAPGYADYRTPISGLYNASSATHAGGGVCGIPGRHRGHRARRAQPGRPASGASRLTP
jgi:phytoene dehydrogenase-like protein